MKGQTEDSSEKSGRYSPLCIGIVKALEIYFKNRHGTCSIKQEESLITRGVTQGAEAYSRTLTGRSISHAPTVHRPPKALEI
jgi:hypothetical protein